MHQRLHSCKHGFCLCDILAGGCIPWDSSGRADQILNISQSWWPGSGAADHLMEIQIMELCTGRFPRSLLPVLKVHMWNTGISHRAAVARACGVKKREIGHHDVHAITSTGLRDGWCLIMSCTEEHMKSSLGVVFVNQSGLLGTNTCAGVEWRGN